MRLSDAVFDDLGLLPNDATTLAYLSEPRLLERVRGPVVTTADLAPLVAFDVIVADDPETAFWDLHHSLGYKGFFGRHENEVGLGTRIHRSAVIGKDGFEHHNGEPIAHFGWVHIGARSSVGAHSAIDRSLWKSPTSIGDDTHIDNLVHIAHNVVIGDRCRIVAGTVIGGSATLEDDVFVGIGARIRPGVRIGAGAFIGMSVTVLCDVTPGARLTCRSS